MRRIILLLAVAAMLAVMVMSAGPANAGVTSVGGNTGSSWDSGGFFVSNGFGGDVDSDGLKGKQWTEDTLTFNNAP